MSTYGRKSLVWWDFDDHSKISAIRYNHTPKEVQLKILQKWYPIGLTFTKYYLAGFWNRSSKRSKYIITKHVESSAGWFIEYEDLDGGILMNLLKYDPINPIMIDVDVDFRRHFILQRLL